MKIINWILQRYYRIFFHLNVQIKWKKTDLHSFYGFRKYLLQKGNKKVLVSYTNYNDINGVPIFEGSILAFENDYSCTFVVYFNTKIKEWKYRNRHSKLTYSLNTINYNKYQPQLVVIGNKYLP